MSARCAAKGPGRGRLHVRAVAGLPDLVSGDDLVRLVLSAMAGEPLADGDVLTVSSKAVAKVEGRTVVAPREVLVEAEGDRDVARRGPLRIVRTRHGLVLAAAGVDASNTAAGTVVPLPVDPDASARRMRTTLLDRTGRNVAVVVTDTAGRAWRTGQTDLAVGCAGLLPLLDLVGQTDAYGHVLEVTAPAVADEVAGAAELVLGKTGRTPVAVVSGLRALVLPGGEHGPGAVALVRPEADDLFGLGSRDAVRAAVSRGPGDRRGFATTSGRAGVRVSAWATVAAVAPAGEGPHRVHPVVETAADGEPRLVLRPAAGATCLDPDVLMSGGAVGERLRVLAWADGWELLADGAAQAPPGAVLSWSLRRRP